MADIRQSTVILDDFARADETPIQNTVAHPWVQHTIGDDDVRLFSQRLGGTGTSSAWAYWDGPVQSDDNGGVPEVWARAFPSYSFPFGTRMAIMSADAYGYANLETGGFNRILRKYKGGGLYDDISGDLDGGSLDPATFTQVNCLQLLRLTSTHFEVWRTEDPDDDTVWTLSAKVPNTTYRDNMKMWLGATGNEDGWEEFGGGPRTNRPQIYRWIKN